MTKTYRHILIAPLVLLSVSLSSCGAITKIIFQAAVEETIECSLDPDCGRPSTSDDNTNPPVTTSGTVPAPAPIETIPPADPDAIEPAPVETVPIETGTKRNSSGNDSSGNDNFESIVRYVSNSPVDFESRSLQISGKVIQANERELQKAYDSGVAAKIEWNDGVISTILFLKDSRVRVWDDGLEYEGQWFGSSSDTLQVRMDEGSRYVFR